MVGQQRYKKIILDYLNLNPFINHRNISTGVHEQLVQKSSPNGLTYLADREHGRLNHKMVMPLLCSNEFAFSSENIPIAHN